MQTGRRFPARHVSVILKENALLFTRFAFVVSTRVDKRATARNRMKRLLSEAIRLHMGKIQPGWDVVVIVNDKRMLDAGVYIGQELQEVLGKAGLTKNN